MVTMVISGSLDIFPKEKDKPSDHQLSSDLSIQWTEGGPTLKQRPHDTTSKERGGGGQPN